MREKCLYLELFWSAFSRMRTEYGEIRSQTANKTKTSDQLNIFIEYIEKLRESRNYTA